MCLFRSLLGAVYDTDNCPLVANPSQEDHDNDTIGDECDNCVFITNTLQEDSDNDGAGRECDANDNDGSVGIYVVSRYFNLCTTLIFMS